MGGRRPHRRGRRRPPRPPVRLYLEGEQTETRYFEHLRSELRLPVTVSPTHGQASRLVEQAGKDLRKPRNDHAALWCVFDFEHTNMKQTMDFAAKHDIPCAVSNPCFELWLLLHFRDLPGPQDARSLTRMLQAYLPGYNKRLPPLMLKKLDAGRNDALRRARTLHEQAQRGGEPWRNPVTTVYRLVEALEELARRRSRR